MMFLKVLRLFLTLWSVVRCSQVFPWVLRGSERFLKVLKCSLTFWGVLRHPEAFLNVMKSCERLLKIVRDSMTFCGVLRRSEAFSWLLSISENFLKVHRRSLTFCCFLWHSEVISDVTHENILESLRSPQNFGERLITVRNLSELVRPMRTSQNTSNTQEYPKPLENQFELSGLLETNENAPEHSRTSENGSEPFRNTHNP